MVNKNVFWLKKSVLKRKKKTFSENWHKQDFKLHFMESSSSVHSKVETSVVYFKRWDRKRGPRWRQLVGALQPVGAAGSSQQPHGSEGKLFFSQQQRGFSDYTRRILITFRDALTAESGRRRTLSRVVNRSPSHRSDSGRRCFFSVLIFYFCTFFPPDSFSVAHSGFFCWHGRLSRCQ